MNPSFDIPDTWVEVKLGDVVDYGEGIKVEPYEINDGDWVLELEDIQKDTSKLLQRLSYFQRKSKSTKTRFNKGDILYGKLRPYLNKVIIADQSGFCTTEIVPLSPNQYLDSRFLFYWLKSPYFLNYVVSVSYGLNMPRLGTKDGRNASFILVPLNEQKRIADKLDALITRVDTCREHLERVPEILKRFRQAVLAKAVSGKLTEEWRAKQSIAEWEQMKLGEVCISISDGNHQAPPKQHDGIPFITISDISDGHLDLRRATRFVSQKYYDQLQVERKAEVDDVLYSVTGSIGIPVLVDIDAPFIFQRHLGILKPNKSKILSRYLVIVLGTDDVKRQAYNVATGTAQLTIPLGGLRNLRIPLPALDEQKEIIRRVETLFAFLDDLENRYKAAHKLVDDLTPALLAKAFRGELVPQNPNDEPASELVERIRVERKVESEVIVQHRIPRKTEKVPKREGLMRKLTEIKPTHLSDILKENGSMVAERLWRESDLSIDDFYEQLKDEESKGLLKEARNPLNDMISLLEAL